MAARIPAFLALGASLLGGCGGEPEAPVAPLPLLGEVAEFSLVDQTGARFSRHQLYDRIWVVDFFFTRCPSICPVLTGKLAEVAAEWRDEPRVHFLSFTVDPDFDKPETLLEYQKSWRMPERWTLLTGDREVLRALSFDSFKLAFSGDLERDGDITHASRFVLLDQAGRIRGYYSTDAPDFPDTLHAAVRQLLAESR